MFLWLSMHWKSRISPCFYVFWKIGGWEIPFNLFMHVIWVAFILLDTEENWDSWWAWGWRECSEGHKPCDGSQVTSASSCTDTVKRSRSTKDIRLVLKQGTTFVGKVWLTVYVLFWKEGLLRISVYVVGFASGKQSVRVGVPALGCCQACGRGR